jgi:hypothetical protein
MEWNVLSVLQDRPDGKLIDYQRCFLVTLVYFAAKLCKAAAA